MMVEPATRRAARVLVLAADEAATNGEAMIGTAHLLVGLCVEQDGVAARALTALGVGVADIRRGMTGMDSAVERDGPSFEGRALAALGVDLDRVRRRADEVFGVGVLGDAAVRDRHTAQLRNALEHARFEAFGLGHAFIGTEHLLLGLLDEPACVAARILTAHTLSLAQIRAAVLDTLQTVKPVRKRFPRHRQAAAQCLMHAGADAVGPDNDMKGPQASP